MPFEVCVASTLWGDELKHLEGDHRRVAAMSGCLTEAHLWRWEKTTGRIQDMLNGSYVPSGITWLGEKDI